MIAPRACKTWNQLTIVQRNQWFKDKDDDHHIYHIYDSEDNNKNLRSGIYQRVWQVRWYCWTVYTFRMSVFWASLLRFSSIIAFCQLWKLSWWGAWVDTFKTNQYALWYEHRVGVIWADMVPPTYVHCSSKRANKGRSLQKEQSLWGSVCPAWGGWWVCEHIQYSCLVSLLIDIREKGKRTTWELGGSGQIVQFHPPAFWDHCSEFEVWLWIQPQCRAAYKSAEQRS